MAKVSEIGEFGLIDRIRSRKAAHDEDVVVGIGDDCAVIRRGPLLEVLTTDCLVEGSHYERDWLTMADVGWKALAVNVSDVAAMGGTPRHALVTLFLPAGFTTKENDDLYDGIEACGESTGVSIVGGDIVKTKGPFAVSVTLSGICERDQVVLRSGAREGDIIVVTGSLGEARVGLEYLRLGKTGASGEAGEACVARFRRPIARLVEAHAIVRNLQPTSMVDLSDGLVSDLRHVLEASGVGAVIDAEAIPVGQCVIDFFEGVREEALSRAVAGGEDYELLFTIDPGAEGRLAGVSNDLGVELTPIGRITRKGSGVKMADRGGEKDIEKGGFDHFKTAW
jgi:thiamine-monophosphate kinase